MIGHHPAAGLFPMLLEEELAELAEDIKANGLLEPLWTYNGLLLDGRNRLAACERVGVEPQWREYRGSDPIGFAISLNLKRRHLTVGQKSAIGYDILPLYEAEAAKRYAETVGRPKKSVADLPQILSPESGPIRQRREPLARDRAAAAVGASGRAIAQFKRLAEKAPALADEVRQGLPLDNAERQLRQQAKAEKVAEIAARPVAEFPGDRTYPVLYVDPPWRYEHVETDSRKIENHYPTMTPDELAALEIPAADDAVLFMWATSPKLAEALDLIRAWDFDYRTCAVWVKDRIGMGYYFRQRHELLLVARRGTLPVPGEQDRPDSVIEAPRLQHSAKPPDVYALIERMYPSFQRLELFAREARDGWDAWGNQAAVAS